MKRLILVALLATAFAAPSFADVTVKATASGKGMGMSAGMTTITYIKGNKMRTDTVMGDTTRSMIFDVDNQRLYSFDSKKKEADAVEKGWIFSDPRAAKGQPGQAKAMAEIYKELAATGGIPDEMETNIKMGGEGPMASMMAKMGNMSSTTTVTAVETGALAADLFAPPAGYKIKEQK
ncbi:MAG: hypothetical protein EXQ50_12490 [Acidobacteria bacterium]|nr:hypothetical protein [Acidobacteriota bacterium]MSO62887.1 hypothetical protein [Acidobacteriota bacterium]